MGDEMGVVQLVKHKNPDRPFNAPATVGAQTIYGRSAPGQRTCSCVPSTEMKKNKKDK